MKCKKCKNKAITDYPIPLCKKHFIEYYENLVDRIIKKYKMFSKDDKILVAVSGGKDSAALVKVLDSLGYDFDGLYINLRIPDYSEPCEKKVKELFKLVNKKIYIINIKDLGLEVKQIGRRPVCSVCGVYKRYLMNKFAYENGYDVLLTAHNLSDEVSFFFMNIRSGNIQYIVKQKPVLPPGPKLVKKARPLFMLTEKENMLYSLLNNLPVCHIECPYSEGNTQVTWKKILYEIESKNRGFMNDLGRFIIKTSKLLKDIEEKGDYKFCKLCGYPTNSNDGICAFCKIKIRLAKEKSRFKQQ